MEAEIITVGTEIILGSIINTNSVFLSKKLMEIGIETHYHTSVDDDYKRLESVMKIALDRSDIVILTGGLGPTDDDLTKEAVANVINKPLVLDINMQEHLKNYFAYSNRKMTDNNLKQAMKPSGAEFIPNPKGTAPGIFIKLGDKKIILMPGPPKELEPMFENYVIDLIKDDFNIVVKSINTSGIGESSLETELKSLDIYMPDFTITTYASSEYVEIKVIGRGLDLDKLNETSDMIVKIIESKIGNFIFGYDNKSLAETLLDSLKIKGFKMAVCESCTGGNISKKLTSIEGASKVFDRGIITYSNKSKIDELNVNPSIIKNFGVVSQEVAYAMAKGLLEKTKANLVISTTGYAGPDEDSSNTGLVYICIMNENNHKVYEMNFPGDRKAIIERATNFALTKSLHFINNN
ncbi:MAG: competence/damage-inducible protein A [Gudongella sp.]|nr:competence/damage-inducible protein A [Gudongella sp.]